MRKGSDHVAAVERWMSRALAGQSAASTADAFAEAFGALWRRAETTLGEVSLGAIVDRVLRDSVAKFPILAPLKLSKAGLDVAAFREQLERIDDGDAAQIRQALPFVLVHFLTVLGNLTADILTRPLHAELSRLATMGIEAKRRRGHGDGEER